MLGFSDGDSYDSSGSSSSSTDSGDDNNDNNANHGEENVKFDHEDLRTTQGTSYWFFNKYYFHFCPFQSNLKTSRETFHRVDKGKGIMLDQEAKLTTKSKLSKEMEEELSKKAIDDTCSNGEREGDGKKNVGSKKH
ncbi:hypothetical protein L1987_20317 [Smallanthus sonchifolius]|uniref:Uncharacterized protein n=1 Tax=Smallanthus sonchifolius TaxID=185202 RepID=A0ACB9ITJ2_9ASTR|nr:hypothetical protein L1987_20317 [Smallanthus sonchifolius]